MYYIDVCVCVCVGDLLDLLEEKKKTHRKKGNLLDGSNGMHEGVKKHFPYFQGITKFQIL